MNSETVPCRVLFTVDTTMLFNISVLDEPEIKYSIRYCLLLSISRTYYKVFSIVFSKIKWFLLVLFGLETLVTMSTLVTVIVFAGA